MKKIIAVFLCAIMLFSASNIGVCAKTLSYNVVNTEKNYGKVSFDNDYAEIGVPLKVIIDNADGQNFIYRWYIDGKRIENESDSYTPIEYDLQSMISVEVFDTKGNDVGMTSIFVSDLPVIYIETENRQPIVSKEVYLDAEIRIQGNKDFSSDKYLYEGKTEIRGRGNSTWIADKKSYRLKLDSKANLLGMGKNKHWVLLSNPFDTSLLRNHISYNLAADMGLSYQETAWVDVVLNGKVIGNYQLCEHIRVGDNRVEITNWEDLAEEAAEEIYDANKALLTEDDCDGLVDLMSGDMSWTTSDKVNFKGVTYTVSDYIDIPDINGGYLIEVVKKGDEYTFMTKKGSYICIDTPEVLSEDMLSSIQGYYQAFENALFSEDFCTTYEGQTMRYTDFIDIESFAKGFLLNELFENFDFGRTSTWMSKDVDGKLVYGPVWDMDNTLISTTFFKWTSLNIDWLKRLLSDPVFLQELRKTYFEYRYTAIQDLIKDNGDIDTAIETISSSAKHNDYIWDNQIESAENAIDLKLRLQNKINWFDSVLTDMTSAYASMANSIANKNFVASDAVSLSFDRAKNSLSVEFKDTLPSSVKIFADGKLCTTQKISENSTEFILPKIKENAVITVVCYDEKSEVLFGSYCITENEIVKLFVSSRITKFTYDAGEPLALDDIELTARYSDGTEKKVKPQLAYTYVKDALGEQFFSYDKVTEEIGKTFIAMRYENSYKEYEIQVNARENYHDVITMIKKLPKEITGNSFVRELFEAKIAYDALSENIKAKVTNVSKLNTLMAGLSDVESESTGVVACIADGVFRSNARSSLLVVSKGNPYKLVFTNPDTTTSTYTTSSDAYLYKKIVGDYTVSTIRHMMPNNENHQFSIKPVYDDLHKTDDFKITVSDIAYEAKAINSIRFVDWSNQGETFELRIDKDKEVEQFAFYENGNAVKFKAKTTGDITTIRFALDAPGKHTLTLCYSFGSNILEYGSFDVYVREFTSDENRIYSIDYPQESYSKTVTVTVLTSADLESISLVSDEITAYAVSEDTDDMKMWTAEIDITSSKEYTLHMNAQPTQTVISPKFLDSFLIEGTKLVKFLADTPTAEIPENITEIADDAFDGFTGTILCYPDSAAEEFAKAKGIAYETFRISANATEITVNSGESFEIEITAEPYLPSDFCLHYKFDESVIGFDGKTITALTPGYSRLEFSSASGLYRETVYVYVGGGPKLGDVSADGKINSMDALLILQHSVEITKLNGTECNAADINGDGKINSLDALIVLQISTGLSSIWQYI